MSFKPDIMFYAMIGFVCIILYKLYQESDMLHLKCVLSTVDGTKYCVRDRDAAKTQVASNLLASTVNKCKQLVEHMATTYPGDDSVVRLKENFRPDQVKETLPTSTLTAYSENKGEKIAFCLNKKNDTDTEFIDENTLTFVAIHEMAHLMTSSVGHLQDFWTNFKWLLENAKAANIYQPVDYKNKPQEYCGMTIHDNPLYDM